MLRPRRRPVVAHDHRRRGGGAPTRPSDVAVAQEHSAAPSTAARERGGIGRLPVSTVLQAVTSRPPATTMRATGAAREGAPAKASSIGDPRCAPPATALLREAEVMRYVLDGIRAPTSRRRPRVHREDRSTESRWPPRGKAAFRYRRSGRVLADYTTGSTDPRSARIRTGRCPARLCTLLHPLNVMCGRGRGIDWPTSAGDRPMTSPTVIGWPARALRRPDRTLVVRTGQRLLRAFLSRIDRAAPDGVPTASSPLTDRKHDRQTAR